MSTKLYDQQFRELKHLSWYPWVGDNYPHADIKNRMLFIGESHYLNDDPKSSTKYKEINMTRWIVSDQGYGGNVYKSHFFKNTHDLIFGKSDQFKENSKEFWNAISFYNFVQTPMLDKKNRPTNAEISLGQVNFIDVLDVLKPSVCVFLGLKAERNMNDVLERANIKIVKRIAWTESHINGSWGRYGKVELEDGQIVKLIFVKHPSQFFTPDLWHKFVIKFIPAQMIWLKNIIAKHNAQSPA